MRKGRDEKGELWASGSLRWMPALYHRPKQTTEQLQSQQPPFPVPTHLSVASSGHNRSPPHSPRAGALVKAKGVAREVHMVQLFEPRAVASPDLWDRPLSLLQQPLSPCRTPHVGPSPSHHRQLQPSWPAPDSFHIRASRPLLRPASYIHGLGR